MVDVSIDLECRMNGHDMPRMQSARGRLSGPRVDTCQRCGTTRQIKDDGTLLYRYPPPTEDVLLAEIGIVTDVRRPWWRTRRSWDRQVNAFAAAAVDALTTAGRLHDRRRRHVPSD